MKNIEEVPEFFKNYPLLAAGASFFQPGLGQILCGRIKRGIALLFPGYILYFIFAIIEITGILESPLIQGVPWMVAFYSLDLAVRIWAVYDAYRIAIKL